VLATVVALGLVTVIIFAVTAHSQQRHPSTPLAQPSAPKLAATASTAAPTTHPAPAVAQSSLTKAVYYLHQTDLSVNYLTLSSSDAQRMVNADLDFVSNGSGVGFHAASAPAQGLVAIYRLHNHTTGDYVYTASTADRNSLTHASYVNEGAVFYAPTAPASGLIPVYRLQRGTYHCLAVGTLPRDAAVAAGWHLQHIVFYVRH